MTKVYTPHHTPWPAPKKIWLFTRDIMQVMLPRLALLVGSVQRSQLSVQITSFLGDAQRFPVTFSLSNGCTNRAPQRAPGHVHVRSAAHNPRRAGKLGDAAHTLGGWSPTAQGNLSSRVWWRAVRGGDQGVLDLGSHVWRHSSEAFAQQSLHTDAPVRRQIPVSQAQTAASLHGRLPWSSSCRTRPADSKSSRARPYQHAGSVVHHMARRQELRSQHYYCQDAIPYPAHPCCSVAGAGQTRYHVIRHPHANAPRWALTFREQAARARL